MFLILLQIGKCLIRAWHWESISLPVGVLCSEEGLQLCPSSLVVVGSPGRHRNSRYLWSSCNAVHAVLKVLPVYTEPNPCSNPVS